MQNQEEGPTWILRVIQAAMVMPGARVDRAAFLCSELKAHCKSIQVSKAIDSSPSQAGIQPELVDKIANSVIKPHTIKATTLSFGAGIPGGIAMIATIPGDTIQFYWHSIVVSQKLAYLYGWPDLLDEEGGLDEETKLRVVLLIGAMMGASQAKQLLAEISKRFAKETARRLPRYALTKTPYYPLVKTVLKWVGISVTKQSFAKGISKAIPIISGIASGGITYVTFRTMTGNLKNHLRGLNYAQP